MKPKHQLQEKKTCDVNTLKHFRYLAHPVGSMFFTSSSLMEGIQGNNFLKYHT